MSRTESTSPVPRDLHDRALAAHRMLVAFISRGEYEDDVATLLLAPDRLRELLGEVREKAADAIGPGLLQDIGDVLGETPPWRCECGDLNRHHEAFCYRCGAGQPEEDEKADDGSCCGEFDCGARCRDCPEGAING